MSGVVSIERFQWPEVQCTLSLGSRHRRIGQQKMPGRCRASLFAQDWRDVLQRRSEQCRWLSKSTATFPSYSDCTHTVRYPLWCSRTETSMSWNLLCQNERCLFTAKGSVVWWCDWEYVVPLRRPAHRQRLG